MAYSLIEKRDTCEAASFAQGTSPTPLTISLDERADSIAFAGHNTTRGSLLLTQARDSASIAATGATSGLSAADLDFIRRRSGSGVKRWHKFDSGTDTSRFDSAPVVGQNAFGPRYASSAQSYAFQPCADASVGWNNPPAIDSGMFPSGSGSMRQDHIPGDTNNGSGPSMRWQFSGDNTLFYGAGQKFYFQWRYRVNQEFMDTVFWHDNWGGIATFTLVSASGLTAVLSGNATSRIVAGTIVRLGDSSFRLLWDGLAQSATYDAATNHTTVVFSALTFHGGRSSTSIDNNARVATVPFPVVSVNGLTVVFQGDGHSVGALNVVRLMDASGAIVCDGMISSITFNSTTGNTTAVFSELTYSASGAQSIDPSAVFAFTGTRTGVKNLLLTVGDNLYGDGKSESDCMGNQIAQPEQNSLKLPTPNIQCGVNAGLWQTGTVNGIANNTQYQNALFPPTTWFANTFNDAFRYRADNWMTFEIEVDLSNATFNTTTLKWDNSVWRFWAAYEGEKPQLVHWWRPGIGGYFPLSGGSTSDGHGTIEEKFGCATMTSFTTHKDPQQIHPVCSMWWDEFILSEDPIPFPGCSQGPDQPADTNPQLTSLVAGSALDADDVTDVPTTTSDAPSSVVDGASLVYDPLRRIMLLFGGGAGISNYNGIAKLDLDTGMWSEEFAPTAYADMVAGNLDTVNGAWNVGGALQPLARNVHKAICAAGNQLLVFARADGDKGATIGQSDTFTKCDGKIARYHALAQAWTFTACPTVPAGETFAATGGEPAACFDPVSQKVLIVSSDALWTYDPALNGIASSKVRVKLIGDSTMGSGQSLVYASITDRFYWVKNTGEVWEIAFNRATPSATTVTKMAVTGALPPAGAPALPADYDSTNNLILLGPNAGTMFAFDPVAAVWKSSVVFGGSVGTVRGMCGAFDPVNGVYVFVNQALQTWAYKWGVNTGAQFVNPTLAAMAPNTLKYLAPFSFAIAAGAPGGSGDAYHTTDQTTFIYDDKRYGIWHFGGGHAGTANDGLHFFDLRTLAWSNVNLPTPYADRLFVNYDCTNGGWNNPKLTNPSSIASGAYPRPSARHQEQLTVVVGDELVMMKSVDGNGTSGGDCVGNWWLTGAPGWTFGDPSNPPAGWPAQGGYVTNNACEHIQTKGTIAHYDIPSNTWSYSQADAFPNFHESGAGTGWAGGIYDPQSALCWVFGRDGLWTYNPATRAQRLKPKSWSVGGMGVAMAVVYFPPNDKYYWCAHFVASGTTPAVIRYYEITLNRAAPASTPIPVLLAPTGTYRGQDSVNGSTTEMAFDYDPFTKKIWAGPFINSGVISFTWLDPLTMTVGNVSPTNTTDGGFTPNRCIFHNARFDQRSGVWIWTDFNSAKTWAWKPPAN